jgi:hypothetical protein
MTYLAAMSQSYPRPHANLSLTKIYSRPNVSPADIRAKLLERDRLNAVDTRTPGEIHLGDPPRHRSALAQSKLKSS